MTRILALDLSLTGTGIAHTDGHTERFTTRVDVDPYWRIETIRCKVRDLTVGVGAVSREVDVVVVEDYADHSPGIRSTIRLAELGGVIRLELTRASIPWVAISPSALKSFATGKGNASKAEMLAAADAVSPFVGPFHSYDEADAWWLHELAHAHYYGPLPDDPKRAGAVYGVTWPTLPKG